MKKDIIGGVFWTSLEAIINRGFSLVIQLVLARLLLPQDYGVVGMAMVFISFLEVFNDLGMSAALIQKKQENLLKGHFDTAFWTGISWGIVLYLIMGIIGAPLVANFYNEDILRKIIPIMSISLLLNPINLVHKAQLTRNMDFKKLAFINNSGNISAGILAISLAYLDFGVWTLAFYYVAKSLVSLPLYFIATKWYPKLYWDKLVFYDVFGFGIYTTGTAFFNKLTGNIDYLLIGKLAGASALGYYTFAFTITNLIRDQITNIINKVLYPVYTKIQDDNKKMLELFLKIVSINNFIVYPIIVGIFLFSDNLVPIFFGSKWDNSIIIVKILSIAVLIQMLNNSHTILFRAAGKVKIEMTLQIMKSILYFVPLITIGVFYKGAIGGAIGFTIATALAVATSFYFMKKSFGLKFLDLFNAIKVSLFMSIFCIISIEFLKLYIDWIYCLIYYIISFLSIYLIFGKTKLKEIINQLNK